MDEKKLGILFSLDHRVEHIDALHGEGDEPMAWLQMGNCRVLMKIPNRLRGVTLNEDGEAV